MMLGRIKTTALLTAMLVAGLLLAGQAQASMFRGKWWLNPQVAGQLGLTPGEVNQLENAHLAHQQRRLALRGEIRQARLVLGSLFERPHLDEAAIEAQFQRVAQAQKMSSLEQSHFILSVRRILGLERFRRLRQIFKQRDGRGMGNKRFR